VGGEVQDAHLADVPVPHSGVFVGEELMARFEAAAVVAEPDVVAGFGEEEGKTVVVVGTVCARRLEEAGNEEDRIFALLEVFAFVRCSARGKATLRAFWKDDCGTVITM